MKNSINIAALSEFADEISNKPIEGIAQYGVSVEWQSGVRALVSALPMVIGEYRVNRDFQWVVDEPRQLLGSNHGPNPQEYLLSGLGACIMVGFVVGASIMDIQLEKLSVKVEGELDLAGFLNVREDARIPFETINYTISVIGNGTEAQFEELREKAVKYSPNAMTIASNIKLQGQLILG